MNIEKRNNEPSTLPGASTAISLPVLASTLTVVGLAWGLALEVVVALWLLVFVWVFEALTSAVVGLAWGLALEVVVAL